MTHYSTDLTYWLASLLTDSLIDLYRDMVVSSPKEEDDHDLTEDDLKAIAKEQMDTHQETDDADVADSEKFLMSEQCELVTMMSVVRGRFELTSNYIYFFDGQPIKVTLLATLCVLFLLRFLSLSFFPLLF